MVVFSQAPATWLHTVDEGVPFMFEILADVLIRTPTIDEKTLFYHLETLLSSNSSAIPRGD